MRPGAVVTVETSPRSHLKDEPLRADARELAAHDLLHDSQPGGELQHSDRDTLVDSLDRGRLGCTAAAYLHATTLRSSRDVCK